MSCNATYLFRLRLTEIIHLKPQQAPMIAMQAMVPQVASIASLFMGKLLRA